MNFFKQMVREITRPIKQVQKAVSKGITQVAQTPYKITQQLPGNVAQNQANQAMYNLKAAAVQQEDDRVTRVNDEASNLSNRNSAIETQKTQLETLRTMAETDTMSRTQAQRIRTEPAARQEIVNNVRDPKPNLGGLYRIKDEATDLTYGSGVKIPRYNTGT